MGSVKFLGRRADLLTKPLEMSFSEQKVSCSVLFQRTDICRCPLTMDMFFLDHYVLYRIKQAPPIATWHCSPFLNTFPDNSCNMSRDSKPYCKKCRYRRCIAAGMDPNNILTDEEKKLRFRKFFKRRELILASISQQEQRPRTDCCHQSNFRGNLIEQTVYP